ncbi:MOSC domain-containing protein [Roseateles cellulosilyticus]|uniref:MOSC N-terminal beta barrel domain-containing protein n=1 Tax=Pelomonas cellulosilytica TaxID=2906762 RepID=A0ABS8Y4I5_9BURK|nr:MOSC N-terminal beta barrel domain-containing protein [Pelomonas sp. P8]MCE4558133.1 MOSC N-terminal beta barrel domain-containing protein [Pelomonas sp. P8]
MADLVARIAALWRYPVKSCAGEATDTLTLDTDGWPAGDRAWGIVDARGELTWMGAHPRLALVNAAFTPGGLTLRAGDRSLTVPLDGGEEISARGWNGERQDFDALRCWDAGNDAAALLHATTGELLRLVRLSHAAQRRPVLNALHIVSDASLQAWREAIAQPLTGLVERARPNIVLQAEDGDDLPPFIEDLLTEARIGELTLSRTSVCVRCVVPTVDPMTGVPQPLALDALTQLSAERAPGAPVQFGVYARGSGQGRLNVGDRVELSLDFGAG